MADVAEKKRPARKKMLTPSGRLFWAGTVFGVFLVVTVPKMSWSDVADAASNVWDKAKSINVSTDSPSTTVVQP